MITNSLKVSVIIPNYNYEQFVGAAIDSALAIDWQNVEVIVVDDGSTDGSRAVIERYADRVTTIFQKNAGQSIACSNGFAQATGDLILFLDSDDLVDPSIIREAVAVFGPGASKVQFQMQTIDAWGNSLGSFVPQYKIVPSSKQIRQWLINTTSYPTPPGSGNIYSREFVEKVFPLCPAEKKKEDGDQSYSTIHDAQYERWTPLRNVISHAQAKDHDKFGRAEQRQTAKSPIQIRPSG